MFSILYISHILLIHFPNDAHLGYLQLPPTTNNTMTYIVHVPLDTDLSASLPLVYFYPVMGLLSHRIINII